MLPAGDNLNFLQRAANIPASHAKLVTLTKELVNQLESTMAADKVFQSEHVKKALDGFIDLIIRTAQEIKRGYSGSKISMTVGLSPSKHWG